MTTMTDRELLELAAKACGMPYWEHYDESNVALLVPTAEDGVAEEWDPLTDDGDAFRLMVKLCLLVDVNKRNAFVAFPRGPIVESHGGDPYDTTRRAIVRAAAAIGAKP